MTYLHSVVRLATMLAREGEYGVTVLVFPFCHLGPFLFQDEAYKVDPALEDGPVENCIACGDARPPNVAQTE